jgi:hypothetical protein
MPDNNHTVREAAYFIWEREGRPEGKELDHWDRGRREIEGSNESLLLEEEKVLADLPADMPAILTKDSRGG